MHGHLNAKFNIIKAIFLKTEVFWYVKSFFLVNKLRRFGRLWYSHPQGQRKLGLDFFTMKMELYYLKRQEIFSTQQSVTSRKT